MRSSNAAIVLLLLLCFVFPASFLIAQTATGQANGTVTDQSGAFVPGATVTLTNQATGIANHATSNDSGLFVFINLSPGNYVLKAEKQGFKTIQTAPFDIGVNQTVTQQLSFALGTASEVVRVTAESALIDSTTTELGTVIPERAVNDLPLNGRNFTQLLTLTPGVTPVSTSQNSGIGGVEGNVGIPGSGFSDASFHGQQNRSKLYFYDGIVNTNVRGPTYIVIPNIDQVQEFKIVGHDAKAEFGGAAGGVVNMVSKSGTNGFHGSAFEYVRNNFFDARNSITDAACSGARCKPGQTIPSGPAPFHQNQFGGVVSGPIIRNKTFFSVGYDGWRYSQPTLALFYVPTAAELSGDFSNTNPAQQIFNPYSTRASGTSYVRDRFRCDTAGNPLPVNAQNQQSQTTGTPCNKIPAALINPAMQQFFQKYSATPNFFVPGNSNNFVEERPNINNSNGYQVRVDHRFRDADNIFFRYTEQRVSVYNPVGEVAFTQGSSAGRNYGGGWTHTFNANLILDLRAGYAGRPGVDDSVQKTNPAGVEPMKQMGFVDIDKYAGLTMNLGDNWSDGGSGGRRADFGQRGEATRQNPNWSLTPNLTWLKGKHNIKTGFWFIDAKRIQLNTYQRYLFSDEQTRNPATNNSGLSLASALLGFPNSVDAQLPILHGGPIKFKYASWATYLQDEWKLTPTITLSMGLRYDYVTQPQTLDGHLWDALDLAHQRYIIGATAMPPLCSQAQFQPPCIPDGVDPTTGKYTASRDFRTDPHFANVVVAGKRFFAPGPVKDNWGPRIGLAWAFTPKMVLRAGYGLYWDSITARSQYAQNDLEAFVWPDATAFSGSFNAGTDFIGGTQSNLIQIQKTGLATPLPLYQGPNGLPWNNYPNQGDDPNYKDPYSHQWNLEIQRELSQNTMVSVAYAGSTSRRLPYGGNANAASQAFPVNTCGTNAACNTAYNAAVDATRQMPWVTAGVTYSRSIGFSHYNGLEARFQRHFANGLQTLLSYTWSKSTDVSSGYFNVEGGVGGGSTIQNYYDMNTARGLSGFSIPHFLSWATVYELPAGRGKKWFQSGPASWFLGNWQANYIFQARSGQPYNLQVSGDVANLRGSAPGGPGTYARPNIIADPFSAGPVPSNPDPFCAKTISQGGHAADAVHTVNSWFNPCAFGVPSGSFGNLGRNAFRGPHVVNMDFSMFKSFPLGETRNLQLRFEGFNVFNIQNYDVPRPTNNNNLVVNSGSAILAAAAKITSLAQGTTPRQLQFGLRFVF
ncbi:MAG TPA: TonB-dependent receptor [Terriglobales bacterium]